MKFFYKSFFTTMFICALCFGIGSYLLINMTFENSLKQEVKIAHDLSDMIHYSLNDEQRTMKNIKTTPGLNMEGKKDWFSQIPTSLTIKDISGVMSFRISDKNKNVIYSSIYNSLDNTIISQISQDTRAYKVEKVKKSYYIHTVRPTTILEDSYYIEVFRDVSPVFENRIFQYKIFFRLIIVMLIFGGIFTAITSRWIMKPISRLSKATQKIAKGDISQHVPIKSNDEVGVLSQNFNIMSEQLKEKISELKDEAEKQEIFVASFSHELKTPLTSMIGYADMLRSKKMEKEKVFLCGDYIFKEGKRLENLSMKLLELIVVKNKKLKRKLVSTIDFSEEIKNIMNPIFENENIYFEMQVEEEKIYIDSELLQTACINILDNARKAITENGKVVFKGEKSVNGYIFSISDNGKGMEEEEIKNITKAFYMVDKSRARIKGSVGLGLALCDEIVKLHEAKMDFKTSLGKGTSVTIHLKGERNFE